MGLEQKNKEARDRAGKRINQHGEEPPTRRTPNMGTHQVPAIEQSAITPKGKQKQENNTSPT